MKKFAAITMPQTHARLFYVCTEKLQETAEVANADQQKKHSSILLRKRKVQYDGVKHLMHVKHF